MKKKLILQWLRLVDATNIVDPCLSVITNVSLEHKDVLGKTVEKIAFEKAGIIKKEIPVITAAQEKALSVIEKVAKEKNASLTQVDNKLWKRNYSNIKVQEFIVKGNLKDYNIQTGILGEHQGENIALYY